MASLEPAAERAGSGGEYPSRTPEEKSMGQDNPLDNFLAWGMAGGIIGAGGGALTGLLFGAVESYPTTARHLSISQKLAYTTKEMRKQSIRDARVFAKMGSILFATECLVKKARGGSDDITNKAVAGCVTGGVLTAKGGPTNSCMGCVVLSTMVVASEMIFNRHTRSEVSIV